MKRSAADVLFDVATYGALALSPLIAMSCSAAFSEVASTAGVGGSGGFSSAEAELFGTRGSAYTNDHDCCNS